jgi:hypothetical protein
MSKRFSLVFRDFDGTQLSIKDIYTHTEAKNAFPNSNVSLRITPNILHTTSSVCRPHHINICTANDSHIAVATTHSLKGYTEENNDHTVVADVPVLPKRTALRNCVLITTCIWFFTITTLAIVWKFRSTATPQFTQSKHVAFFKVLPPRKANERSHCTFTVGVTSGRPSKLQLVVTLALALAESTLEENIVLHKISPGLFDVDIARCTDELHSTLTNKHFVKTWNIVLEAHHDATITLITSVEVEQAADTTNTSFTSLTNTYQHPFHNP